MAQSMNRAFTIYVPDDCELDAIQMTVVVKRKNGASRGCTFFNKEELRNDDKWIFTTDGRTRRIKKSEVASEVIESQNKDCLTYSIPCQTVANVKSK